MLHLEVANLGSSPQIHDDLELYLSNSYLNVMREASQTKYKSSSWIKQNRELNFEELPDERRGSFYINDIPAHSSVKISIPVDVKDFKQAKGMFKTYTGDLESVVKYNQYYDDGSSNLKNELLTFPYMP